MTFATGPDTYYDYLETLHADDRPVAEQPPTFTDAELEANHKLLAGTNLVEEAA